MALTTLLLSSLAFLSGLSNGAQEPAQDWPHLRGPQLDGTTHGTGVFEQPFTLVPAWRTTVGSAYSGVAVSGSRVVTLASNGEVDVVLALDATTGKELWRQPIGPTYLGHDGSMDGPISSPVIGNGMVYAVGPRGRLVALSLEDGAVGWTKELAHELGAVEPDYGFGTTPLLEADVLILQAGGSEGRALCGFDAASGELRWSLGDVAAGYQSPVGMDLAGRRHIVVMAGKELLGVAPESGELLWRRELVGRDAARSGFALALGDDRFCADLGSGLVTLRVTQTADGYALEELYRSRELGRTYASPVHYAGHLYGFKSDFLTCVDASTGKRVWKSRPPGGKGLVLVDDRLVIFGSQGVLAVARATPAGYEEEARVQALEHSSFTWPSFASGRIYLRNSDEVACIDVAPQKPGTAIASSSPSASPRASGFGKFVQSVESADAKDELIAEFLAKHAELPVLEGNLVHFVYNGDVDDIALGGSMTDGSKPEVMQRIAGTGFHHKTYEIEPGARWEYRFQVDFEDWIADPANPRTVPAAWGAPMSEVLTPDYTEPEHLSEPTGDSRGRLETFEYESEALGNKRELQVYLPAGYDESEDDYPLLIVHQGPDWLEKGQMVNSLDNLIGKSVAPLVVVFVAPMQQWWFEGGGTGTRAYVDALANEFVPYLEQRYRLSSGAENRALMGHEAFGLTAAYGALLHPDVFGKAAVQSISLEDVTRHHLFELIGEGEVRDVSFYIDWNRYEARNMDSGYDYREHGQRVSRALRAKGYDVAGGEALDAHGWAGWRSRTDDLLEALFPQ